MNVRMIPSDFSNPLSGQSAKHRESLSWIEFSIQFWNVHSQRKRIGNHLHRMVISWQGFSLIYQKFNPNKYFYKKLMKHLVVLRAYVSKSEGMTQYWAQVPAVSQFCLIFELHFIHIQYDQMVSDLDRSIQIIKIIFLNIPLTARILPSFFFRHHIKSFNDVAK